MHSVPYHCYIAIQKSTHVWDNKVYQLILMRRHTTHTSQCMCGYCPAFVCVAVSLCILVVVLVYHVKHS